MKSNIDETFGYHVYRTMSAQRTTRKTRSKVNAKSDDLFDRQRQPRNTTTTTSPAMQHTGITTTSHIAMPHTGNATHGIAERHIKDISEQLDDLIGTPIPGIQTPQQQTSHPPPPTSHSPNLPSHTTEQPPTTPPPDIKDGDARSVDLGSHLDQRDIEGRLNEAEFRGYWRKRFSILLQRSNASVILHKLSRILPEEDKGFLLDRAIQGSVH